MQSDFLSSARSLPMPGDPVRAGLGLERWRERARDIGDPELSAFAAGLAAEPQGRALLSAIFGNSPFLTNALLTEMPLLRSLLADRAEPVFEELLAGLRREAEQETDTARFMGLLRVARRRVALLVALADLTGHWPLEAVTAALSRFADTALHLAATHLLRQAASAGEIEPPDPAEPARGCGLVVLGMGKLGARELNYSSDIDLILLYERERLRYRGRRTVQDFAVRFTRELVRLLQDRTAEGYVFRVDLRLRPDPASTPLAMSVLAAETYYEGMGQNWERAAMIKARPVAGDIEAGLRFLRHIRPFVWRKHLDFAAIQDVHSIKRQIQAVKGHRAVAVGGHNIKLGRGGIREIEFFAQTQQLIWGGREPALRAAGTCEAIRALVAAGRVKPAVAEELIAAYRYLRLVEHRLQMIEDRQTQTLPQPGPELDALARFVGHRTTEEFTACLLAHLGRVEDHYAELFEEAPHLGGPGSLVFTGTENDPDTVRTLAEMGFRDGASISAVIRGWHFGRYRATRSTRARELLTELMPTLLQALADTPNPDAAFAKFDEFLAGLPAGVQLFSLLHANPGLLAILAEIMGGAPRLAEHLSRNPILLDAVLTQGFFDPLPGRQALALELERRLEQATDFQDVLDLSRRWAKDRQFQAGVRLLRGAMDAAEAGHVLADIADAAMGVLLPRVTAEFERKHGRLPGDGLAVVALGKLGSREMSIGSDVDLIFIYDVPPGTESIESDGRKPLAPLHYYARLSQRFINALAAATGEGRLFEVDMRLRPSGNAGPIASSLEGFRRYQQSEAWTWEHMALTRARVVAGAPAFAARVEGVLREILCRPRDPGRLVAEVDAMRRRIARQHRTDRFWDLKHRRGGLVDIEFIAQYLQLRFAAERPDILAAGTLETIGRLRAAELLATEVADELGTAMQLWLRLQGVLRLTLGGAPADDAIPAPLQPTLARAGGAGDFAALCDRVAALAERAARQYDRLIAEPAGRKGSDERQVEEPQDEPQAR